MESSRARGPRRTAPAVSLAVSGFVVMGLVSGQSFWLTVLPGGRCLARPRWIPARRILGVW